MKFKYLLPAAMLASAMSASAVPAYPGLIERTLEDGSKVMVRLTGDEYFSYMTDEDGFLLEQKGNALSYKTFDGARVMADNDVITRMRAEVEASAPTQMLRAGEMQRMASLNKQGRTNFCTTGDVHFCVLLVQYDDIKFNSPTIREDMDAMLNKEGYDKNGCKGSIRDYYIKTSNGKFTPTFDVSEVITLPKTSAYYANEEKYGRVQEMVQTAIEMADPKVDFSKYCNVTAGECDAVIIWYAGYGQADTSNKDYIWPHQSTVKSLNLTADGVKIGTYCCFNELNGGRHYSLKDGAMAGIGTPIHEFGHVMGMPDLYDPAYKVKSTPGKWSVFDQGPYLSPTFGDGYCPPACSGYERWMLNWTELEDIQDGVHYDLEDLNKAGRALRIPVIEKTGSVRSREFWVLESRHQSGLDEYIPGSGMLIWHVDYDSSSWSRNTVNSSENHKRCYILSADGSANYDLGDTNVTSADAAWPYQKNYITPDTEITFKPYYSFAQPMDSYLANISYDQNTGIVSFDYNIYKEQCSDVTIIKTPTRGLDGENPTNNITFKWDPVEGATGYALTVYRKSGTKIYYEDNLNEKAIGNVTEYTIPDLTKNKMKLEYHAYVRVIKGLPSTEQSNEVTFIPNDLEAVVGIADNIVDNDVPVLGMKGAIQAPAGAEIYNMQGARCNAYGLNPGVYVVRTGNKVTKVLVR